MSFDERAKEHWEYVKNVLLLHGEKVETVNKIGFHYVSAMRHAYGHGLEDAKKEAEKR